MIFFNCPECDCRIGVDDRASGKVAPCAECGKVVAVPEPSDDEIDERERKAERKRRFVKYLPDEAPHGYVLATEIVAGLSLVICPLSLVAIIMAIVGLSKYSRNRYGLWASLVPACLSAIALLAMLVAQYVGNRRQ